MSCCADPNPHNPHGSCKGVREGDRPAMTANVVQSDMSRLVFKVNEAIDYKRHLEQKRRDLRQALQAADSQLLAAEEVVERLKADLFREFPELAPEPAPAPPPPTPVAPVVPPAPVIPGDAGSGRMVMRDLDDSFSPDA